MWRPLLGAVTVVWLVAAACEPGADPRAVSSATSATAPRTATAAATPATAVPTPTMADRAGEPRGFPLDPGQRVGWVDYRDPGRVIRWGDGPGAFEYSRDYQPRGDADDANAGGWNCRIHVAFEGRLAVDWYIPIGTPIRSVMDGTATLYAITTTNAFDYYGVARSAYVGNPAPGVVVSPFPGPGGGKGIFVEVRNDAFATESAHLEFAATLGVVPADAYLPGFTAGDLPRRFVTMRGYLDATPVASWPVRRGDVIGFSGDSGYSEAPHLHYTIRRVDGSLLCPTLEAEFADGGWLLQ